MQYGKETNMNKIITTLSKIAITMGFEISYQSDTGNSIGVSIYTDDLSKFSTVFISAYTLRDSMITIDYPQICGNAAQIFKAKRYINKEIQGIFLVMLQRTKATIY